MTRGELRAFALLVLLLVVGWATVLLAGCDTKRTFTGTRPGERMVCARVADNADVYTCIGEGRVYTCVDATPSSLSSDMRCAPQIPARPEGP